MVDTIIIKLVFADKGDFMDVLLLRHGESLADIEDRHEGRADFKLTELGCKQAQSAARWIKDNYEVDIILSSPLKRASKTAEFISEETKKDIEYDDDLMEWDNGLLAGLLREEAMKKYPLPEFGRKPHDEFAETESYINFRSRAEMFWSKFLHKYENHEQISKICIVSHGGMINMLFRSFMMLPVNSNISIRTGDTGMHLWSLNGGQRNIIFSNRQDHLLFNK